MSKLFSRKQCMKKDDLNCFAIVLSCFKNYKKIEFDSASNLPFDYRYFIGKPNHPTAQLINKKTQTVDCPDNYESLIFKVHESIKWVNENIKYDYILKTDDDIKFNQDKIKAIYKKIKSSNIDYTGFFNVSPITTNKDFYSRYHFGKCEDSTINSTPILCPAMNSYASGGAYFLSKKAVSEYLENFGSRSRSVIFEDFITGEIMNNCKSINISRDLNEEIREAFCWR